MPEEIPMSEGGGEPSGAPPTTEAPENQLSAPQDEPQGQPGGQPPAQPGASRLDGYRRMQTGFRGRMEARNRELRALKDERERLQGVLGSNNETMRGILETIRKQREGGEGEAEMPDPALDPAGFAAWQDARLAKLLDERLGPVVKDVETRREREEREAQERQQAEQQQAQAQEFLGHLEADAAAYEEMAPELAAGATDRVASFRGLLADAFTDAYGDPQQGNQVANLFVRGVAIHARNMGQNMAAAVDAAVTGMIVRMGEAFGIPIEPDGLGGEMGGGNGHGNGHQPAPQPQNNGGEIARLERVRQRARGAANAAPALPARDSAPAGKLQDLVRAGVTDVRQLHRAALQDAHGNMMEAQRLLGQLLPGQA